MVVVHRMVGFQLNIALLRHKWMDYIPRGTLATRVYKLHHTCVRACPSLSWGPRSVMVLMSESKLGTSTHTPVEKMIKKKKASERGRGWGVGGGR